jgi:hypothetical protein
MKRIFRQIFIIVILFLIIPQVSAQTTVFNYQGRLTDGGNPANGAFQMEFKLFDSLSGGSQIGGTISDVSVTASNGVFSTKLDFGANALSGANRWLEIAVRHNSGESYTVLSPREQIASSPYAVRTLSASNADNALSLGGIPASEYVTNASVGSSFIRNGLALQTANFNISGSGFFGSSVGIGTTTLNHRLNIAGSPCWTGDCWGGAVGMENASAIGWKANTSGVRFGIGRTENGLFFFRTNAELGTTTAGPIYDFKMDNNGNLGIGNLGISTDLTGAKLNLFTGGNGFKQTDGTVSVTSFIGGVGAPTVDRGGWFGTQSNHPLYFFTNNSSPQLTVTTAGNVGIGTITPNAKLQVAGNVTQTLTNGGLVKAMVYVNNDGSMIRCYNGVTGSSSGNCGFTSARLSEGVYEINFGFQVDNRFVNLLNQKTFGCGNTNTELESLNGNIARVNTFCASGLENKPFMIFVY